MGRKITNRKERKIKFNAHQEESPALSKVLKDFARDEMEHIALLTDSLISFNLWDSIPTNFKIEFDFLESIESSIQDESNALKNYTIILNSINEHLQKIKKEIELEPKVISDLVKALKRIINDENKHLEKFSKISSSLS